jgi:hypothetical protein
VPNSRVKLLILGRICLYLLLHAVADVVSSSERLVGHNDMLAHTTKFKLWSCGRSVVPWRKRQYVQTHLHSVIISSYIGSLFLQNCGNHIPEYTASPWGPQTNSSWRWRVGGALDDFKIYLSVGQSFKRTHDCSQQMLGCELSVINRCLIQMFILLSFAFFVLFISVEIPYSQKSILLSTIYGYCLSALKYVFN